MKFLRCFLINFTYTRCKVTFFMKHFLISPILYEGSTLINFRFLIKETFDMWSQLYILQAQVSALLLPVYQIWVQFTKSRKVDNVNFTKNSKSYKIRNFFSILAKFLKENYPHFIYDWGLPCNNSIGAWRHLLSLFSSDEIGNLSDN